MRDLCRLDIDMKTKLLIFSLALLAAINSVISQDVSHIRSTIQLSGKWEVSDIWYDEPVDINIDGAQSRFAAEEYDFCSKYQTLDLTLLNGKATHKIGESHICPVKEVKLQWYVDSQKNTVLGVELEKPVLVFVNKRGKKICQLVVLHTNPHDILLFGNLPGDRFSKPGLVHLSRELPALTAARAD